MSSISSAPRRMARNVKAGASSESADAVRLHRDGIIPLDTEQNKNKNKPGTSWRTIPMIRFARESLALASVAGFVWMVCQVAQFAG